MVGSTPRYKASFSLHATFANSTVIICIVNFYSAVVVSVNVVSSCVCGLLACQGRQPALLPACRRTVPELSLIHI